jgi:hypothetical protein
MEATAMVKPFILSPGRNPLRCKWIRENVRQSLYIEFATASPFGLLLPFVAERDAVWLAHFGGGCSMLDVGRVVVVR